MRKRFLSASLLMACAFPAFTQLITTSPRFIHDTGSITILFDVSKGNQAFLNATDSAYVHIGVILGNNPSPWDSVPFAWGTANALAKANYLGNNRYQYTISNVREFFKVPAGIEIKKIAILLRDASGNKVQRNRDGSDMYIPVTGDGLTSRFITPLIEPLFVPQAEPLIRTAGDKVVMEYVSNKNAALQLYYNGNLIESRSSATSIKDSITISSAGSQIIVGRATEGSLTRSDTIRFFVSAPTPVLPQPSGTRDGINYQAGDTSVVLVLHAPGKHSVTVLGEFNNWTESPSFQMNKTPDGKKFWIRINALEPGKEYAFQYLVNSSLRIADPYAEKILDPNNDPFISAATYPGLKAYPAGQSAGIVSVIQTAAPVYTWQIPDFQRPDKRNLIIYELLLRDFVSAHDWKTVKDTLSYFKTLGVNAIELLPFNEFEGNLSWGYNPSFYFAPDKYYGTKNRLKEFVDECHKNGIAVIMDIALNHSFGQSPMVQLYFDAALNRPASDNPWFNPVPKHAFNVGYDMNHQSAATRYFTGRVVEHWLKEYKIDGFRFDLSKGFTQKNTCDANGNNCNVESWSDYDDTRIAIWKDYYDTVQSKSSGAYVILEHFADNSEERQLADYGMMFWGNVNHAFGEAAMGHLQSSNFESGLHTARGWEQPHLISYMESHDEERIMYKLLKSGNSASGYNTRELNTALRRMEMASAFFLMLPGPKMIWQFGETGYQHSINHCEDGSENESCRTSPKPIHWEYRQVPARQRLYDAYSAFIKLRKNPYYSNTFLTDRVDRNFTGAFKWLKVTTDTSDIMLIGNFDVTPATGSVRFPAAGTWYDYLSGTTINATGVAQQITLQPGEYHIYLNRNITQILTPVSEVDFPASKFGLNIYPNPVKPGSFIEYELPENGNVHISVLNVLGRQIGTSVMKFQPGGIHKTTVSALFNHTTVPSGTYFLRLEFKGKKQTKVLIVE